MNSRTPAGGGLGRVGAELTHRGPTSKHRNHRASPNFSKLKNFSKKFSKILENAVKRRKTLRLSSTHVFLNASILGQTGRTATSAHCPNSCTTGSYLNTTSLDFKPVLNTTTSYMFFKNTLEPWSRYHSSQWQHWDIPFEWSIDYSNRTVYSRIHKDNRPPWDFADKTKWKSPNSWLHLALAHHPSPHHQDTPQGPRSHLCRLCWKHNGIPLHFLGVDNLCLASKRKIDNLAWCGNRIGNGASCLRWCAHSQCWDSGIVQWPHSPPEKKPQRCHVLLKRAIAHDITWIYLPFRAKKMERTLHKYEYLYNIVK